MKKEKWYQIKEKIRIIVLMFMVAVATYQLTAMDICDSVEGYYILQSKENTLGIFAECVKIESKNNFFNKYQINESFIKLINNNEKNETFK